MVNNLRAFVRLLLFFVISVLTVLLVAVGNILLGGLDNRWKIKWKNIFIRGWARTVSFVIGLSVNIKGTPPKPPFLLVSNHLSYIDVLLFWYCLPATFIAKDEIKTWPFFGWATRIIGVLFIDRELNTDVFRMNNQISKTISDVQGVILFPEATSTRGKTVMPFKSPLLEYPASVEMPVSYASISYKSHYKFRPAHLDICWWGEMTFLSHFWKLLKMPTFEAYITFGSQGIIGKDRKLLAKKLHQAVSQNFEPVGGNLAASKRLKVNKR